MVQGRDALAAKNNEAAVDALNKLLLLPPNDYTQDGQEWIGVARERAGQPDKAKVEYDLYLRLYPEGDGAARVAQRLNGLSGTGSNGKPMAVSDEKKQAAHHDDFRQRVFALLLRQKQDCDDQHFQRCDDDRFDYR